MQLVNLDTSIDVMNESLLRFRDFIGDLLETVAIALLIFVVLHSSVGNYRVELSSMKNTLFPRDRLVVDRMAYLHLNADQIDNKIPMVEIWNENRIFFPLKTPKREDIVVFNFPNDPSRDFVKRVIGLPGEMVSIKNGEVFINGLKLNEPYISAKDSDSMKPILVPQNSYFVLGDNRYASSDSRHWGSVSIDQIVGKVLMRYWPLNKFLLMSAEKHDR